MLRQRRADHGFTHKGQQRTNVVRLQTAPVVSAKCPVAVQCVSE